MSSYEVQIMIKSTLSSEDKMFIRKQIETLAEKYGMYSFDGGITYRKRPPFSKYQDVPCAVAFVSGLQKYKEYFEVLTYYSYLEGHMCDKNGKKGLLRERIYLLTVMTDDSTSIYGAYTDRERLLRHYDVLIETDRRFCEKNTDICIYMLEPNIFYGKYVNWLGEENNHFCEDLEQVDIEKIRNPFVDLLV